MNGFVVNGRCVNIIQAKRVAQGYSFGLHSTSKVSQCTQHHINTHTDTQWMWLYLNESTQISATCKRLFQALVSFAVVCAVFSVKTEVLLTGKV